MAEKKKTRTVNVILRPASPVLKIVVVSLILCSIAALAALRWVHNGITAQTEKLRREAAAVEYANSVLEERTSQADSVQSIRRIAQQELGLIDPDTVIIDPIS